MIKFKKRWEIKKNWQLLFPFLGIISLFYCAYRLASIFFDRHDDSKIIYMVILSIILYFVLLKITLWLFKKLENRWIVTHKWEMIRIFIVFAVTGTSCMFVSKPIMNLFGITLESLNANLYWFLFVFISLIAYQFLLVTFGWLFGQFQFFWNFEKKILKRIGFSKFFKD
ncbi:MAG: hypothetical protein HKO92_02080 [Flavobacteriaceae bacterium]|nr:hypothetical protein [Flavobacteriaceae bacterium]